MRLPSALAVLLALALPAAATGTFPNGLSEDDQTRLERFEEVRDSALAAAREKGEPVDVAELEKIVEGEAVELAPAGMAGQWRCRTIKLDGLLPLVVYRDFECRITDDAAGLRLEKLTGSQRTSGTFYDIGEARLGYAGAVAMGDEGPRRYGEDPGHDQVGYLVPVSPDRMRLELPLPHRESRFDILELRR